MIFHLIWQGVCHLLLVIISNLGRISHLFRDMTSFTLKNAHFSCLLHSTPNLKMFSLAGASRSVQCDCSRFSFRWYLLCLRTERWPGCIGMDGLLTSEYGSAANSELGSVSISTQRRVCVTSLMHWRYKPSRQPLSRTAKMRFTKCCRQNKLTNFLFT